jgi:hypothetical protein
MTGEEVDVDKDPNTSSIFIGILKAVGNYRCDFDILRKDRLAKSKENGFKKREQW